MTTSAQRYLLGGSKSVCKHLYSNTKQKLHPMKMNYWSFYVTVFTNWALWFGILQAWNIGP